MVFFWCLVIGRSIVEPLSKHAGVCCLAKEHELVFDDSEHNLEVNQHDLQFDDSEEEPEEGAEANKHKAIQASNAETACKMCEDEGVDFDVILQAQQANAHLQSCKHELLDSDSSDKDSAADIEANVHGTKKGNNRPKIEALMEFSDSEGEDEFTLQHPGDVEEALAHGTRAEMDDPDEESAESIKEKSAAKMPEGLLQFSSSEEEEDEESFQLRTCGFNASIEEAISDQHDDEIEGEGSEGIVGEQESHSLTATQTDADHLTNSVLKEESGSFRIAKMKTRTKAKSNQERMRPK